MKTRQGSKEFGKPSMNSMKTFKILSVHFECSAYSTITESDLRAHKASLFFCLLLHLANRSILIK
jgi:hypothetical protein